MVKYLSRKTFLYDEQVLAKVDFRIVEKKRGHPSEGISKKKNRFWW